MANTVFTVDLGNLKLTEAQRGAINAAIQKAVAGELAGLGSSGRVVLIPVTKGPIKGPLGPIINGIIARPIKDVLLQEIIG